MNVEAPVPPSATAKSVIPVIVPESISTFVMFSLLKSIAPSALNAPIVVNSTLPNEPVDANEPLIL